MSLGRWRALVDSNVLYSRTLRDWIALMYLAKANTCFDILWTEDIMAEVIYHLRKNHPHLADEQVGGVRRRLAATFAAGAVTGYAIDPSAHYPDIYDAHVHCAAVHARADYIITLNASDFEGIDDQPYEVYSPDDFLVLIDDSAPEIAHEALHKQMRYHLGKGSPFSLPRSLVAAGAPVFADRIRQHAQHLDIAALERATTLRAR
ncbi:PIN domain-containing protein [Lolliginicoccus levis]|uniref:PIN domain-containing protein n=1 Tax=Lolliginicoccus levis TaxID=2919542 RepID=UPI00241DA05C|nr:PIN domain-containing protein [Lolliginicoccus levis]